MCRIALFSNITSHSFLAASLAKFERSMGGDGNGYTNTRTGETVKGIGIPTNLIAAMAVGEKDTQIFHTRMATYGGRNNDINHPFDCGEYGTLVHNGSWYGWQDYPEASVTRSDTHCVAEMIKNYGPGVLTHDDLSFSGVWVLAGFDGTNKILIAHRGQHDLTLNRLHKDVGGGWMLSSELPFGDRKYVLSRTGTQDHNIYIFDPDADGGLGDFVEGAADVTPAELPEVNRAIRTYGGGTWRNWDDDYYDYSYQTPNRSSNSTNAYTVGTTGGKVVRRGKGSEDSTTSDWSGGTRNGRYVACNDCGTYDLVSMEVKQSEHTCQDCKEFIDRQNLRKSEPDVVNEQALRAAGLDENDIKDLMGMSI